MGIPLWARALLRTSRLTLKARLAQEILRDELLFAYLPASERSAYTIASYTLDHSYVPGGSVFEGGLFDWERAVLDAGLLPRTGRVLLAAAGGGRELLRLSELGYTVTAFEPAPTLLAAAQGVAADLPGCRVRRGSYQDLCTLARAEQGPLLGIDLDVSFAWLGWGSFSHLTEPGQALAVLGALRTLLPRQPVVLSYLPRASEAEKGRGARRLREALRRGLGRLGGTAVPEGLSCHTLAGFCYLFTREEFLDLCREAGYRPLLHVHDAAPHAVLAPAAA